MIEIKQGTAKNLMVFMVDLADHVSGKTGLTLTITASKDGGAFAAITPTVTERGSGWYNLALTASHTDTLGDLCLHVTGTGADPTDLKLNVVANVEADTYSRIGAPAGASIAADIAAAQADLDNPDQYKANVSGLATAAALALAQADLDVLTGIDGVVLATDQPNYAPLRGGVAMTESYAADGAAATPEQMFYMLWAALSEFIILDTTITCKKLDGTTTAMTFTMDDATTPTSRTRSA